MNPLNIFQMMKNGNPQQFLQQMMGNNQVMRNPLMKNTIEIRLCFKRNIRYTVILEVNFKKWELPQMKLSCNGAKTMI